MKVYLPLGGTIDIPAGLDDEDIRDIAEKCDASVEGSELVKNDDGSVSFVKAAGTKG